MSTSSHQIPRLIDGPYLRDRPAQLPKLLHRHVNQPINARGTRASIRAAELDSRAGVLVGARMHSHARALIGEHVQPISL